MFLSKEERESIRDREDKEAYEKRSNFLKESTADELREEAVRLMSHKDTRYTWDQIKIDMMEAGNLLMLANVKEMRNKSGN